MKVFVPETGAIHEVIEIGTYRFVWVQGLVDDPLESCVWVRPITVAGSMWYHPLQNCNQSPPNKLVPCSKHKTVATRPMRDWYDIIIPVDTFASILRR
jgi:hypothetical protein